MKIWKYSGILLIATGILHTIVAIAMGIDVYAGMIKDSLFNSVKEDPMKGFALWFFVCGLLVILLGYITHDYIKKTQKPVPSAFGYSILLLSILGCIVEPISGFWLFIPQALIIIFSNKKNSPLRNNRNKVI